jgi:hypothetical protein
MNEMTSVAMKGSCVRTMVKISAGSSGARRLQSEDLFSDGLSGPARPVS